MLEIPKVFPRNLKGSGRFVQIIARGEPFMRFAREVDSIRLVHSQILEKFLKENNLEFKSRIIDEEKIPETRGKEYEAVGMGVMGNDVCLGNKSVYYNIGIDREHFEKIKPYLPPELNFEFLED